MECTRLRQSHFCQNAVSLPLLYRVLHAAAAPSKTGLWAHHVPSARCAVGPRHPQVLASGRCEKESVRRQQGRAGEPGQMRRVSQPISTFYRRR